MALVLIAELEPDLRLLAEQAVIELGHRPLLLDAHDGDTRVDVLVLGSHPCAIAQALRRRDPGLPIVSIGALPAATEVRALRPVAHLVIPYTLSQLARALTRALATRGIQRESTQTRPPDSPLR